MTTQIYENNEQISQCIQMAQKLIYHNLYYVFRNIFFKLKPIRDKIVVKDKIIQKYIPKLIQPNR